MWPDRSNGRDKPYVAYMPQELRGPSLGRQRYPGPAQLGDADECQLTHVGQQVVLHHQRLGPDEKV